MRQGTSSKRTSTRAISKSGKVCNPHRNDKCNEPSQRPSHAGCGTQVALELKRACEKCGATLARSGTAYICSYECTYCPSCAEQMNFVCPNCGGELVRRPRRKEPSDSGAT